jgi:hypothetical protein
MELPEGMALSSLVRLDGVNSLYRRLPQALYISPRSGFVFRGVVEDWEISLLENALVCRIDPSKMVGQMIQRSSKVEKNVPSYC